MPVRYWVLCLKTVLKIARKCSRCLLCGLVCLAEFLIFEEASFWARPLGAFCIWEMGFGATICVALLGDKVSFLP